MEEKEKIKNRKSKVQEIKVIDKRHSAKESFEGEEKEETPAKKYPSYVEELRSELDKKDKIFKEYIEAYKKMKEENKDFRTRFEKDMERRLETAKIDFICSMLEIFDNLDRALDAAEISKNMEALIKGVRMIQAQFFSKLKNDGIEELNPVGKPFDPQTQEAVEIVEVEEKEKDNIIISQGEKGYLIGGRLLRPAKVRVGKIKDEKHKIT